MAKDWWPFGKPQTRPSQPRSEEEREQPRSISSQSINKKMPIIISCLYIHRPVVPSLDGEQVIMIAVISAGCSFSDL